MIVELGEAVHDKEVIKLDWEWQSEINGDTNKGFQAEVIDNLRFLAFAIMRQGFTKIKVVHSIARCPTRDMPKEVTRVTMGFTGDRRPRKEPQPVEIPVLKGWAWCTDKVVKDGLDLKSGNDRATTGAGGVLGARYVPPNGGGRGALHAFPANGGGQVAT